MKVTVRTTSQNNITVGGSSQPSLVNVATPGLKGDSGDSGTKGDKGDRGYPGTNLISAVGDIDISGHSVIAINPTRGAVLASSDNWMHSHSTIGISLNASIAGAECLVLNFGPLEHSGWNLIPGQTVFLGLNGTMVQTIPSTALYSKIIGIAVTSTSMVVNIQTPIFLPN